MKFKKSTTIVISSIILFLVLAIAYNTPQILDIFKPSGNNFALSMTSNLGTAGDSGGNYGVPKSPNGNFLAVTSCSPESGYDYCDQSTYSYGSANAIVKLQMSNVRGTQKGGYYVGEAYVNAKIDTGKLYTGTGIASWTGFWDNIAKCGDNGCSGTQVANTYKLSLATAGQQYTQCPVFLAWNKATASNGDWAWTSTARGWVGTCNLNVKVVACYDNADCSSSQYCDKSSTDWKQWSCKAKECDTGQEKCVGTDTYTCSNYKWALAGKVVNKCGVECLTNGEEKCTGNILSTCNTNKFVTTGAIINKCGVECTRNSDCSALSNSSEPVCAGTSLVRTVKTGVCDVAGGYKCSTQSTQEVVKTCMISCSTKENLCFENTTTFRNILIGIGIAVVLIIALIIFLVVRKRRK